MSGTHWSQVMPSTEDLDKARGKELQGQFHQLEPTIWSVWRRFDYDGVSGVDSRCNLSPRQQQRVIPWDQPASDANWNVAERSGSVSVVLDNFFYELQLGCVPNHLDRPIELILREYVRFALFRDEQLHKVVAISLEGIGVGMELCAALLECSLGPGLLSLLGSRNSVIKILLRGEGNGGVGLASGRIYAVTRFCRSGQFAINDVAKCLRFHE